MVVLLVAKALCLGGSESEEGVRLMAKLILIQDDAEPREFPLDKRVLNIGRKAVNEICLPDSIVSGTHATVTVDGKSVVIEDLKSTNGTGVNGRRISKATLADGDLIQIGRFQLKYVAGNQDDTPATHRSFAGADKTQIMRAWEGSEGPQGFLKVIEGDGKGDVLDLRKPFTAVGRIGQQVALVTRRKDGFSVRAVNPAPPAPLLNGKPLGTEPVGLREGDVIEVAGQRLEFFFTTQVGRAS